MIGIYKITSPSGKIYIGQTTNFTRRKNFYKNGAQIAQTRIYYSLQKYGYELHNIEFIEHCLVENLNERERHWQDFYNVIGSNGLNCRLTEAENKSGFMSDETKIKMAKSRKGRITKDETRKKLSLIWKGRKHTEETKLKMSNSAKGKKLTYEHIAKLPQNQKGYKRPNISESTRLKLSLTSAKARVIFQYDLNGYFIKEWRNASQAAKELKSSPQNISTCARGKLKTAIGYKWSYTKF